MGIIRQIRIAGKEQLKQERLRVNRKYQAGEVLSDNEQATLIDGYAQVMGLVIDPAKLAREMACRQLRLATEAAAVAGSGSLRAL
jgi:hypothetical protein